MAEPEPLHGSQTLQQLNWRWGSQKISVSQKFQITDSSAHHKYGLFDGTKPTEDDPKPVLQHTKWWLL